MAASTVQIILEGVQGAGTLALLAQASSGIEDIKDSAAGAVDTLKNYATAVIAIGAAYATLSSIQGNIEKIISVSDALEKQQLALAGMATGAVQAEHAFDWVQSLPGDTEALAQAFIKLQTAGLDPTAGTLQALNQVSIALSGSQAKLADVTGIVAKAFEAGSLSIKQIDKLIELGIPAWQLLTQVTGKQVEQLIALAREGNLGRDVITRLVQAMGGASAETANKQLATYSDLLRQMAQRASDFFTAVGQAGVLDAAKTQLSGLLGAIDQLKDSGRWDAITQALGNAIREIITAAGDVLKALLQAVTTFAESGELQNWASAASIALHGLADSIRFAGNWFETFLNTLRLFEAGTFILKFAVLGAELYAAGFAAYYVGRALLLIPWATVISNAVLATRAIYQFGIGLPVVGTAIQWLITTITQEAAVLGLFAGSATLAAAALYILWMHTQAEVDAINQLAEQQGKVAKFNESFISMRRELEAMGERSASLHIMDLFTTDPDQFKRNLELAKKYFSDIKTLDQQRVDTEKRIADLRNNLVIEQTRVQKEAADTELATTKTSLNESLQAEKQIADQIKQVRKNLSESTISDESAIRDIRRRNLSDNQKQADIESEINSLSIDNALALLKLKEDISAADAKALSQEIKDRADRQIGLAKELTSNEMAAIAASSASEQKKTAYRREIEILDQLATSQKAQSEDFQEQVDKIQASVDDLENKLRILKEEPTEIKIEADIEKATEQLNEIDRRLAELRRGVKIPITVDNSGESAPGFAGGGLIPGYGGGDRIYALLEAGEFVMRKEAVQKVGTGILNALNGLRLPSGWNGGLPQFANGGPVGGDTVNLNISLGGSRFQLFGARDQVKGFSEAMTRLARGLA